MQPRRKSRVAQYDLRLTRHHTCSLFVSQCSRIYRAQKPSPPLRQIAHSSLSSPLISCQGIKTSEATRGDSQINSGADMTRMLLQTFLANDLVDSVTKASRLSKYGSPGGSDYWWGVKQAARRMINDGESYDQAVGCMSNMSVHHQLKDNQDFTFKLYQWKLAHGTFNPVAMIMPIAEVAGPKGELVVKLEPNFAIKRKGVVEAYVLWTFKELRLTSKVARMGIHMLELALQHDAFENWKFFILDVTTGEKFGRRSISAGTPAAVAFALRTQEELLVSGKAA